MPSLACGQVRPPWKNTLYGSFIGPSAESSIDEPETKAPAAMITCASYPGISQGSGVICMVDNCYGEFVQKIEPTDVGADMVVGSLIKNPGGGLAPIGGYIAGKKECVENAAFRLTSPGLGKEVGASLGVLPHFHLE